VQNASQVSDVVVLTAQFTSVCKAVPYHKLSLLTSLDRTSFATFQDLLAPLRAKIQAMASTRKPVIVRKFSREWYAGYAGASFGQDTPSLEVLDLTGKVLTISWDAVKWVCYVRDFSSSSDLANPERLLQKRFAVRPRATGLWLRMTLNDGEELEGIAANDRSLVTGVGLLMTPPDTRSNTQRIYIPRQAIQSLEVVSLIGSGRRRRAETGTGELFPTELDSN
jgi:hypothetical protein